MQYINDMSLQHIQNFAIQQWFKILYYNEDGVLKPWKIHPLTNRNPNGSSANIVYSSRSAWSVSCYAENIGHASLPTLSVNAYALQPTLIISDPDIAKLKPSSEVTDPVYLIIDTPFNSSTIVHSVIKEPSLITTNYNQLISRFMKCIKDITTCYITLETFKSHVACNDLRIYENYVINIWIFERDKTSTIIRVPIKIQYNQTDKWNF